MGFRFQRRIKIGRGWGVNTSGTGASISHRSRHGSIGTRGFSLRTGIPGLSFRKNWGKNSNGMTLLVLLVLGVLFVVIKAILILLPLIWACIGWLVLTLFDFVRYLMQRLGALGTSSHHT